jgi:hypothetical protein
MKSAFALASLASMVLVASAFAQEGTDSKEPGPIDAGAEAREPQPTVVVPIKSREERLPEINPSQVTPEFYLYMQELRRHDDPQQAVRRKAEARAAARESRITAMKWYGMSNARPQANPVPFMSGAYSPTWIGSRPERYDWYGLGWPSVSLRVDQSYELQR